MPSQARPFTIGSRVSARELARVDAACRLQEMDRSEYVRVAALERADADLRAEVAQPEDAR